MHYLVGTLDTPTRSQLTSTPAITGQKLIKATETNKNAAYTDVRSSRRTQKAQKMV